MRHEDDCCCCQTNESDPLRCRRRKLTRKESKFLEAENTSVDEKPKTGENNNERENRGTTSQTRSEGGSQKADVESVGSGFSDAFSLFG